MSVTKETLAVAPGQRLFDIHQLRNDFPVLDQEINGKPLVYLDNGATTQKPNAVIEAVAEYYKHSNANVHRGVHLLSERATQAYEGARDKVRQFINAADVREVVFVRGTTEAINMVAQSFSRPRLQKGDEIIITEMDHHSNIVPWQLLCEQTGAVLKVVPINDQGELLYDEYLKLLNSRTRLLAVAHVSNSLGSINSLKKMISDARAYDVTVVVDGAQAVPHIHVDVQDLDCDFYAFSGHKMYGPTGIGVLYGKLSHLQEMEPYQGGGEMILQVTLEKTVYAQPPQKFEAGTPNIAGAIGLGAAIDYLSSYGLEAISAHEDQLLQYAIEQVSAISGVTLVGTARKKASILSFVINNVHAHDVGTILDHDGIAIRAGHLCAMPIMQRFNIPAVARASFGLYNTREEVDTLVKGINNVKKVMGQ